mgnify:CR=1 FL=1
MTIMHRSSIPNALKFREFLAAIAVEQCESPTKTALIEQRKMHKHHKAIDKEKILDYEKPRRVALVCSRGVKDGKVTSGKEHK